MTSAIAEASGKADEIEQKIQEFFEKVNGLISWVPWPASELIGPIEDGLEKINQEMQKFWQEVQEVFTQRGDPDRLREAGAAWAEGVGNALGEIAGKISLENHKTNIEWTGSAAEAYRAIVPAQKEALNGLKDLALQMRTSLDELADSVEDFWFQLIAGFVAFVIAIGIGIATAAGVVTIPVAIGIILGAVAAAIAFIVNSIDALTSHIDVIRNQQTQIQQGVTEVGSEWKASNIGAISDASALDGDPSDWRPA